ncbi:putative aldose 1-epimerase [Pseudocercospora fuligena]|uniref:Putative aldose 1-epimerase n=1 Tax=Pseudocercospora fuligena TaxID=685502 RepID=A0A8H6RH93_9PEZI|nr:putative aldose 1-epimerase [Pseudocercospora fuligena]
MLSFAVLLASLFAFGRTAEIAGNGAKVLPNGKYELQSEGIRAQFIPYAASITNLFIKDVHGVERDIVLGFDNATIKNSTFTIDGNTYHTDPNDNKGLDTLHGGSDGWDYRNWTVVAHTTDSITFSLVDPDGKEGFPGEVIAYVTYALTPHSWHLRMSALSTTKKTPIMLSSHDYWNLDGYQNPDTPLILNHTLHMPYAGQRIAIDGISIPTGEILSNPKYSLNDFWSSPKQLGANLTNPDLLGNCGTNCTGYDNCYLTNRQKPYDWRVKPVATLASPFSGIQVDVFTEQEALQVYTCNNMNGTFALKETQGFFNDSSRPRVSNKYGCVVIEVEDWIDGINHPEWGREEKQIFGPGDGGYELRARYDFSLNQELVNNYRKDL